MTDVTEALKNYTESRKQAATDIPAPPQAAANTDANAQAAGSASDDKPVQSAAPETTTDTTAQPDAQAQVATGTDGAPKPGEAQPDAQAQTQPATTDITAQPELDDDAVLNYLKNKKGISIDGLEQLSSATQTPEQQQAAAKAKRDKAISFGLNENLFDAEALEQYNVDSNANEQDLAYKAFSAQQKAADASISEEEIRERFEEEYGLNQEEDSWRRKNGIERMQSFKKMYLEHKYNDIMNAEQHYDAYLQQDTNIKTYAKTVEQVFSGVGEECSFKLTDKNNADGTPKDYEVKFRYDVAKLNELKKEFLSEDVLKRAANGEVDAKALTESVNIAVMAKFMPDIIREVANSYHSAKLLELQMERQGVLPVGNDGPAQGASVNKPNYSQAYKFVEEATGRKLQPAN